MFWFPPLTQVNDLIFTVSDPFPDVTRYSMGFTVYITIQDSFQQRFSERILVINYYNVQEFVICFSGVTL